MIKILKLIIDILAVNFAGGIRFTLRDRQLVVQEFIWNTEVESASVIDLYDANFYDARHLIDISYFSVVLMDSHRLIGPIQQ